MGSWGVGMMSNDTAWDIIGKTGNESYCILHRLLKSKKAEAKEILALAEHCLEEKTVLEKQVVLKVLKYVDAELDPKRLDEWKSSDERKDALLRFKDRLNGRKVDELDIMIDNLGVVDKISLGNKSRSEIKKLLKKAMKKGK